MIHIIFFMFSLENHQVQELDFSDHLNNKRINYLDVLPNGSKDSDQTIIFGIALKQ